MYAGHLIHKWSISAQTLMRWGWGWGGGVNWNEKTWDKSIDSAVHFSQHYKVRFKSR